MTEPGSAAPFGDDERDDLLVSLLARYPGAAVTAMDELGRVVEVPERFALARHHVAGGASPFELIVAESRGVAVDLWTQANAMGAATGVVTLTTGGVATCHVVDVRSRHGVFVGVMVADDPRDLLTVLAEPTPIVPRSGRIRKDELGIIREADADICAVLGFGVADLVGTRSIDLVHPDDRFEALDAWVEMLRAAGGTSRFRARHRCGDGTWRWLEITNINHLEDHGWVSTEMVDISREVEAVTALRHSEQLLRRLAEALPSGVLHIDGERRVVYVNGRLERVLGVEVSDTIDELLAVVIPEDRADLDAAIGRVLLHGADGDLEVRLLDPTASTVHLCGIAMRALSDAAGRHDGAVLCIDDVTGAAVLRAELERRATVDDLTGCLNRAAVLHELDRVLRRHAAGSPGTAVVFIDLDGFKEVNDTYGHTSGDQLLTSVVTRLGRLVRTDDVIGRLGGDEFIVVLPSVEGLAEATEVGRRIEEVLRHPLEVIGGMPMRIRASVGVAWSSEPDVTATAMTSAADEAMYTSKRAGRSEAVCVLVG